MVEVIKKTYGIKEGYHKGQKMFFVICDGRRTALCYRRPDYALKVSEQFIRSMYKPFTSGKRSVVFEFEKVSKVVV